MKPILSDKETYLNKITLADNDKLIWDDKQLCKTFSNFFEEKVKTLEVSHNFNMSNYSQSDPVNNEKEVWKLSGREKDNAKLYLWHQPFLKRCIADVKKSIGNLNSSKVQTFKNISTKCLKVTCDICNKIKKIIDLLVFYLQC